MTSMRDVSWKLWYQLSLWVDTGKKGLWEEAYTCLGDVPDTVSPIWTGLRSTHEDS